jgi:hypothetical protein
MSTAYDFAMRLVADSIETARFSLSSYHAGAPRDLNRFRDLLAARAWVGAAKTNFAIAQREAGAQPRLKLPRSGTVKGGRT